MARNAQNSAIAETDVTTSSRRRNKLRAVLLTGAGLFIASGLSLWSGENGTEAATPPTGRTNPVVAPAALDVAAAPDLSSAPILSAPILGAALGPAPIADEKIVLAAADILSGSQPALDAWRSTSTAEPEAVTSSAPPAAYAVAALEQPLVTPPAATSIVPLAPRRPIAKASVGETFSRVLLGKWVPNRDVCTDPDASEFLPLEISSTKAVAGDSECTFTSKRKVGGTWSVVAQCSDGTTSWTSNVNIDVTKAHLTWASERGTQSYERCDSPVGVPRIASRHASNKVARATSRAKPNQVATKRTNGRPRA